MSTKDHRELRVGMVGYAFMGAVHSHAWRTVNRVFDLPVTVRMVAVCGRDEELRTQRKPEGLLADLEALRRMP